MQNRKQLLHAAGTLGGTKYTATAIRAGRGRCVVTVRTAASTKTYRIARRKFGNGAINAALAMHITHSE